MELEKKIYLNSLYDIYYELFTLRQQEIIELFFEEDLSVSEIAKELSISLPAVSKSLKEIENKLLFLEQSIGVYENYKYNVNILEENEIDEEIIKKIK